ncbi:metallophosphoesterase family protein [Algoriphagus namhaensis]
MSLKIALISDTHGFIDEKTLGYLAEVDEIWHAGDIGTAEVMSALPKGKVVRAVYGNIDDEKLSQTYPEWQNFALEGVKVLMTHIGGKPPRYAKGVRSKIEQEHPRLFICGHSHILKVEFDQKLNCLYMNPGAVGRQGFHQNRTFLLFELQQGDVKNLRVVDLGKRGQ